FSRDWSSDVCSSDLRRRCASDFQGTLEPSRRTWHRPLPQSERSLLRPSDGWQLALPLSALPTSGLLRRSHGPLLCQLGLDLLLVREVDNIQHMLGHESTELEEFPSGLVTQLLVHIQAGTRNDPNVHAHAKLLDVEVDHLPLGAFTPDGDLAARTLELADSQAYQAAQPANGLVLVTGLLPHPGLAGLLKLGNGRSRRDTRGPPPLG